MNEWLQMLVQYGYLLLFAWLLAEQLGPPLPSAPPLLSAGTLAGSGRLSLALAAGMANDSRA